MKLPSGFLMRTPAFFILVAIFIMTACSGKPPGRSSIAVTSEPQAQLLDEIVGDDFNIITLLPPNVDPESYEPSVSSMVALQNCHLYFHLNTPGFERNIIQHIRSNFPEITMFDVSVRVNGIRGTHGNSINGIDPHILSSLRNARLIASRMRTKLTSRYPEYKDFISANADSLDIQLKLLDDSISKLLQPIYGSSFVVFHPFLTYFARDYGLNQIALEEEGKEPSPKQFKERLDSAKASRPLVLFYQKGFDRNRALQVAEDLDIKAVEISMNSRDFRENILKAAHELGNHRQ